MNGMRVYTCNESVFSLPLCSSDERSTSLYISTASTNSSAGGTGKSGYWWHSICPSHVELMRRAIQSTPVQHTPHYIYRDQQNISVQKVLGETKMRSWLVFCWTDSHGKLGAEGAQVQKWGFILLMMWIPARPLSAHTNCLWASSHSTRHFFCRDFRSSSIVMVLERGGAQHR